MKKSKKILHIVPFVIIAFIFAFPFFVYASYTGSMVAPNGTILYFQNDNFDGNTRCVSVPAYDYGSYCLIHDMGSYLRVFLGDDIYQTNTFSDIVVGSGIPPQEVETLPALTTEQTSQIFQNILSAFGLLVGVVVLIASTKFGLNLIKKLFPNAY